eukprot:Gb_13112 [translate_table: standard]
MSKRLIQSCEDKARFAREVEIFADLPEHPNVVKYYRCWEEDSHIYIHMELCEGNLQKLCMQTNDLLPETQVWNYIEQVASGLAHIHANGILHMDIKPDNILVGSDGVLKIGDFNQATKQNQLDWEEGDGGYVAPELLRDEEPGPETDMYSFGAMVYEWATGENFPRSCLDRALIQIPTCRSKALRSLVHALLNPLRHERPTATDVLKWRDPREESNP